MTPSPSFERTSREKLREAVEFIRSASETMRRYNFPRSTSGASRVPSKSAFLARSQHESVATFDVRPQY